jgi:hypothetical protein
VTTPVNLNRFRKDRAKAEAKVAAAGNRVKFGRSKAEKSLAEARRDKAAKALDDLKRD